MHPVAVKCIKWAVGLFVVGALINLYAAEVLWRLSEYAGVNAAPGLRLLDAVLGIMRFTLMPVGGSLVGAAVVIQTLAPQMREAEGSDLP